MFRRASEYFQNKQWNGDGVCILKRRVATFLSFSHSMPAYVGVSLNCCNKVRVMGQLMATFP